MVLVFQSLLRLQYLNLSQNHLRHFPAVSLECSQLSVINLSNNQVRDVSHPQRPYLMYNH